MLPAFCDGVSRREFVRVGSLAGMSLSEFFRLQSASAAESGDGRGQTTKKDVNCIFIFMLGGMSHHDTFDLKPEAPEEIRCDFKPISSAVPGIQVSEILPDIAKVTDKLAILRGMTHGDSDHGRGYHIMMTGAKPGVGDFNGKKNNNQHPSLGSMVARIGRHGGSLPPYISLPNLLNSGGPAFLGASYAPFVIESDPASPEFSVRDISLPTEITNDRNARRQAALREVNRFERRVEEIDKSVQDFDTFYQKAYSLMTSE